MNQHFDYDGTDDDKDFEASLSAFNLASPSKAYGQIPQQLEAASGQAQRTSWSWITAFTSLALIVTVISVTAYRSDFSDLSSTDTPSSIPVAVNEANSPLVNAGAVASANSGATTAMYQAGEDYLVLDNPVATLDGPALEVVAFFWYPCWPCHSFEEHLQEWETDLDRRIALTRVPVMWSESMRFHARAYFAALATGVAEQAQLPLYQAFRKDNETIRNDEDLATFFSQYGVAPRQTLSTLYSAEIESQIALAEQANADYAVQSTPMLFVAGKYAISPAMSGDFAGMLDVADHLIRQELESR